MISSSVTALDSIGPTPRSIPTMLAAAFAMIRKAKKEQNSSRDARPEKSAYFFNV